MNDANRVNCGKPQTLRAWAIRSQAPTGEGSSTSRKTYRQAAGSARRPYGTMRWSGLTGNREQGKSRFGNSDSERTETSIVPLTMELVEQSVPQAEGIMQDAMEEAYGQMLDTAILSNSAAVPGVRPAGLLNGVTVATGNTTGGYASVVADMKTLISALSANRLGIRPLLIINDQDAISASLLMNPLGQLPFQSDLAAGRILGVDVVSSQLVAAGTATIVDCGVLATAFDGPMFRISQEATLTMANADGSAPTQAEDGSGAVGTAGQVPPDGGMEVSDAGTAGGAFANGQAVSMFQTLASIASFCGNAVAQLRELLETPSWTISSQAA